MLFASVCGAAIGLERSYKNRPAGFRTHMLVVVGATLASVTGLYLYLELHVPTDMSRLGAQVITGLGFIGAGTIIVTKKNAVRGLTTAAGLWTSGIIGLAIGGGFYEGAIIVTILVLIIETVFSTVSHNIRITPEFSIVVHYDNKEALDQLLRHFKNKRMAITDLRITAAAAEEGDQESAYSAQIRLRTERLIDLDKLLSEIRSMQGIIEALEL